jgi:cytochrome d ubiquinol oxidase subunit II
MSLDGLDLHFIWFILVGVLFTGYILLDGFDLGVGALHLLTRKDEHRRLMLNAIGPVWDGNEVWLVTGGGALFAAFPEVYATVFSAFYIPFMLLLAALIFRGVAIEFRSKRPEAWWRRLWDISFAGGSVLSSFLLGVTLGNFAWGIPLDARHEFAGTLASLLNPYALLMGVTTVALFMMHGAIYVVMKTEGELQAQGPGAGSTTASSSSSCATPCSPWPPCSTCRTWPRPCAATPPCSRWPWPTCSPSPTSRARSIAATTGMPSSPPAPP